MKYIYLFLSACFFLCSCQEDELKRYNTDESRIFFTGDSLIKKTFAITVDDSIIVNVPIGFSGIPSERDRYFSIAVEYEDKSNAVVDIDFKPLKSQYVVEAGEYKGICPVVILRSESVINSLKPRRLALKLYASEDFLLGPEELRKVVIEYTEALSRPLKWNDYRYGLWSKVKHIKFLQVAGISEFPEEDEYNDRRYFYEFVVARALKQFYTDNYPQYDENGEIIEVW